jgi:MFS family permease
MLDRLQHYYRSYPRQYWILLGGMFLSKAGTSFIWPYLTLYLTDKLQQPLSTVTLVLLIDSLTSILSTFLAGSLADRFGRKGVMVFSLFTFGLVYILITQAQTIEMFAVLMGLRGLVMPLYSVGADAMVADLIVEKQRAEAYSLLRMVNNAGIAIGPVVGGFVAAASFASAFLVAAASLILFSFLVFFAMRETLPRLVEHTVPSAEGGYLRVFKDRFYLGVVAGFTMVGMASSLMFVLFSVYAEKNYGLPKPEIGLMMTINALMVVFFQLAVTRFTRRFPPLRGRVVLRPGCGQYCLGAVVPRLCPQHGGDDLRGIDPRAHLHHPGGQPCSGRTARAVPGSVWPGLGHQPRVGSCSGRPAQRPYRPCHLVRRPGLGLAQRVGLCRVRRGVEEPGKYRNRANKQNVSVKGLFTP